MPILQWDGKQIKSAEPVTMTLDSVTYARTSDWGQSPADNKLFLGDNLAIMAGLLPEYEGRINLIYVDPPFFTNRHFTARIGRGEDSRKPQEWLLASSYGDQWDNLDAYIDFLYQRLAMMTRLLADGGSIYLHLDWHADAYARLLLDELLGAGNFLNEIIWTYHGPSPIRSAFNRKHDTILAYTKGPNYTFNADAVRVPYNESTIKTFASSDKAGFGKVPDLERGKVPEDWWYFPVVARLHSERTGYPTQKPEVLLERIILASSNPGDIIADFFCGSGTTPLVASLHRRKFLAVDATFRALHTTRERLIRNHCDPFAFYKTESEMKVESSPTSSLFHRTDNEIQFSGDEVAKPLFWEIDPDWDGKLFRSYTQAVLPLRKGEILLRLPLPDDNKGKVVCVRYVNSRGEQIQEVV